MVGGNNIYWIGGKPPAAEPSCGFSGDRCALPHDPGVLAAAAAVAAAAILAATLLLRHYRYEQKLASVLWRIEAKDLTFISPYNTAPGDNKVGEFLINIFFYAWLHFRPFPPGGSKEVSMKVNRA